MITIYFSFVFRLVDQLMFVGTATYFLLVAHLIDHGTEEIVDNIGIRNFVPIWMVECFHFFVVTFRLFMWNFLHLLIMVISAGLSMHLKLINDKLENVILRSDEMVYPNVTSVNSIFKVNIT